METRQRLELARRDALAFLREQNIGVLATTFEGQPFASAVYYVVDDDFNFYFATRQNTAKHANVAINPHVAFVVGSGPEHISVQVRGTAKVLSGKERAKIRGELRRQKSKGDITSYPLKSMEPFAGADDVIVKTTPTEVQFFNLDCARYPNSLSRNYYTLVLKEYTNDSLLYFPARSPSAFL